MDTEFNEEKKVNFDEPAGVFSTEQKDFVSATIVKVIGTMGIDSSVAVEEDIKGTVFNIASPDSNLLIGQKGANLQALQTVVHNISQKKFPQLPRFSLDVDDYRKKREWYLRETAKKAVEHIKQTGRPVKLEPMSPYERRIVHAYLSQDYNVDTESVGEDPDRRIVIRPKAKGEI